MIPCGKISCTFGVV